ncbi:uncharacterized protein LOC100881281 isoform X2 [Megachile rotundata]|uniref:uncharacterized protein LOC100881281 isoform X2 n=1 Tax=Megachile rotundata TaxID=143995 RepID=UPI0006151492|nr:PREDICTED: uncharacterized protein LOC100881281 isoform X2 [Megachile rotundata]
MEKRSISGKDILRMDGLLPPTRRVPVCNAVTSRDKRKEKKWSLGGILRRISSMRDYDSSSNDEEIVYCTRSPRPHNVFNRKSHSNVILHPVDKNAEQSLSNNPDHDSIAKSLDTSSLQRDSVHRSSDGSLDGLSKKARKNKLKARIEAKRDRICAGSSSDEESHKSCNSLTRFHNENGVQSTQKNGSCNRKSRAARTERYIKRISRDEGHRLPENLNNIGNKRNSLEFMNERSSVAVDTYELFQPQQQSFINYSNSNTFPVQRSVENLRQSGVAVSSFQARSSNDLTKPHMSKYITDLNQNNTYAKPNVLQKSKNHDESLFDSSVSTNYPETYTCTKSRQFINQSSSPPEPPPRDPRFRAFGYGCNSFPFNGKYSTRHDDTLRMKMNDIHEVTKDHLKGLRSYDSSNEISWCGSNKQCPRRPLSLTVSSTQSCNLSECTNNKHNSTGRHVDDPLIYETEAMKCQRRNNRNDQLNSRFHNYDSYTQNIRKSALSPSSNKISDTSRIRSPTKRVPREDEVPAVNMRTKQKEQQRPTEQEILERRRSSKNLEEALSELEAIYNSLRLGDEDLLDRAERRSMEEFSLRQAKTSNNIPYISEDPDRTKDDMAYRRMHPKERPASLSEAVGQSALSNISYLIASPVLTRKDSADDFDYTGNYPARRDEPDVTRDDVVYRSIHRANNTLKVMDPQPPFGIPLGPVTTAPESDYLHTTPTKPDHPRSLYIPQCEPDIVTDDLAYRTLRKDASTKNTVESKNSTTDQETAFGTKKKRAVRSLSANLYGLINHDAIHLRREPSLQEITDQISDTVIDIGSLPARSGCFRRVVSDGELSDYDTRWSPLKVSKTDINGNHSVSNLQRKKLRVYVAPSTRIQDHDQKSEEDVRSQSSSAILSKALNNEFWQDPVQTKCNDTVDKDTDSDFTAYSRLCQDLVNLIEGSNDTEVKETSQTDTLKEMSESPMLRIQSLGSQYAKDDEENVEERDVEKDKDVEELTESLANLEDSEKTDDSAFDFYLRVADENVKLIAEAFSSVADHLRDSRVSQKNSLTSQRSEIETDSTAPNTSTRSSVTYSPDDANDDFFGASKTTDALSIVPKEDATMTLKQDQEEVEQEEGTNVDPELDLSKAVHDLQLAAASLCEHEKEIEELEALLRKDSSVEIKQDECQLIAEEGGTSDEEKDTEKTVLPTDVNLESDERDPNCEGLLAHDHS